MTAPGPVTAVVISKNEERAIGRCLEALSFCDQVVVVDSQSSDRTVEIAESHGAEVLEFVWDGRYPKKKQWGMAHPSVRNSWVLHIDADEIVTPELAEEIGHAVARADERGVAAFDVPLEYHFMGRPLRFGHRVTKRSLVNRDKSVFPDVGDESAPGITEVEGHYQPTVEGSIETLRARLRHDDPDPLSDWIGRHNRYSDWESYLRMHEDVRDRVRKRRSRGGQWFDRVPGKPLVFFVYSYFVRFGFLDGRAGYDYALSLAWYYWLIGAKTRDLNRTW